MGKLITEVSSGDCFTSDAAAITEAMESRAEAELNMIEREVLTAPLQKDDFVAPKKVVREVAPVEPSADSSIDHRQRYEKFKQSKGIDARMAQERKVKTGCAVEIPTPEDVEAVAKSTVRDVNPKDLEKRKKPLAKKPIPKQLKVVKAELLKEVENKFENNPDRTDWVPSDVVDMSKMHPSIKRSYYLYFREMRTIQPGMTYAQAKTCLSRMGNPLRYRAKFAERLQHRGY